MSALPVEFPHWSTYSVKRTENELENQLTFVIESMAKDSLDDAISSSQSVYNILSFDRYANGRMLLKYKNGAKNFVFFGVFDHKYITYRNSMRVNHANHWTSDHNVKDIVYNYLVKHPGHGRTFKAYKGVDSVYIEKL